jgi:hypothetical protein
METASVRQALATLTSAVAGAAVVVVLAAVPAGAGGGGGVLPGPTAHQTPAPAPTRVAELPSAWGRIFAVVRRAVVDEHPDAVVGQLEVEQGPFLGGARLVVQYRDRTGSGAVTVDLPPVGQAMPPCLAPGDLLSCTRLARFDGGSVETASFELGGHSPMRVTSAVVTVRRADGVVLSATAAASVLDAATLRLLAEQAVSRIPSSSDSGGGWLRASR